MKNIFSAIVIIISCNAFSQVIIGDAIGTAGTKTSVLLEFAQGQNKGIILPYVTSLPTGAGLVGGAIVLDATDATKAKVKYFNNTNWVDLSNGDEANVASAVASQPQPSIPSVPIEDISARAIIGDSTSSAEGVLVLESSSKAMVLPIVKSTDDIINPAPGMVVYVEKPGARRLAVFNGANWTYWKS